MSRRNEWLTLRQTPEEKRRLTEVARQRGCRDIAQFARASLTRNVKQEEILSELEKVEKRQAATLTAVRTEIARLRRTEYVLFAMLENLAKTILTYMPPPPAESKPAASAHGNAAYARYLKAGGTSLHNGSKEALEGLTGPHV